MTFDDTPDETVEAPPADPAPAGSTVKVRVAGVPGSTFAHGIDGAPELGTDPTDVPPELVEEITRLAAAHGVRLSVEEGD